MKTKVLGLTEFNVFIHLASEQVKEFVLDVIDSNLELKVTSLVNDSLLDHKARGEIFVPFEGKDLYIYPQKGLPDTLVAKYGNEPGEYLTFNPELMGLSYREVIKLGGIQLELYKRAIGVDAYFKFKASTKHN